MSTDICNFFLSWCLHVYKWKEWYLLHQTLVKVKLCQSTRGIVQTTTSHIRSTVSLSWCSCYHFYYPYLVPVPRATRTSAPFSTYSLCCYLLPYHHSQHLWTFQGPDHILWHQRLHRENVPELISITYLTYHTNCFLTCSTFCPNVTLTLLLLKNSKLATLS
jgi:hypothetical protein